MDREPKGQRNEAGVEEPPNSLSNIIFESNRMHFNYFKTIRFKPRCIASILVWTGR